MNYEKPIATIDLLVVSLKDGIPYVMLTQRDNEPYKNKLSLLGGFIFADQDMNIDDTVKRVMKDKIGVSGLYYEQLETVGSKDRDPRGWSLSVSFVSLMPWDIAEKIQPNKKISSVEWFPISEIENIDLAFDHKKIIELGMNRLKTKINYSTLPIYLLPKYFTLTELQGVYEAFLGVSIDKSGFRKKIKDIPFLQETELKTNKNHRPAKLFTSKVDSDLNFFRSNIIC